MNDLTGLFLAIIRMSSTAAIMALLVILLRMFLKRAPKLFSYLLWATVLFRMLCPFSFSWEYSALNAFAIPMERVEERIKDVFGNQSNHQFSEGKTRLSKEAAEENTLAEPITVNTETYNPPDNQIKRNVSTIVDPSTVNKSAVSQYSRLNSILAGIWLIGMILLMLYGVMSYFRLKRRMKTAVRLYGNIYETDSITSPFVLGFYKPRIYMPAEIGEDEFSYILAHEQAHIRRYDYIVKAFAFLALIVHWFNPMMWLSFRLMSKDMEMSCDEYVILKFGSSLKKDYSSSLLSLSISKRLPAPSPLAFGESNVKSRIKNILQFRKPSHWILIASILSTAVIILLLISNPINQYTVYNHPQTILGSNVLANPPQKVRIIDNNSKEEFIFTNTKEISWITEIISDIRIAKKELSTSRSEAQSTYTIYYYDEQEKETANYNYAIHLSPFWMDNNVKPTYKLRLINEENIHDRVQEIFINRAGKLIYPMKQLLANKTTYVGNHVKVNTLVDLLPVPEEVEKLMISLQTEHTPYGLTVHYQGSKEAEYEFNEYMLSNSIMLFSLVDNLDTITYQYTLSDSEQLQAGYTITRSHAEEVIGGDVRNYSNDWISLGVLADKVYLYSLKSQLTGENTENNTSTVNDKETNQNKELQGNQPDQTNKHEEQLSNSESTEPDNIEESQYEAYVIHNSMNSPDNRYLVEAYGVNDNITAGGLYPAEGIRIVDNDTNEVLWQTYGYYEAVYHWSADSRYLAITGYTRISSEVIVVDLLSFTHNYLSIPEELQNKMRSFRPDPYFKATGWSMENVLSVSYEFIGEEEDNQETDGIYEGILHYNPVTGD